MTFKTPYNSNDLYSAKRHEAPTTQPSLTVPDQSMSVQEIMRRFASGLPIGGSRTPLYEGEDDFTPDFKNMDLAEKEQYLNETKAELDEIKERLNRKRRNPVRGLTEPKIESKTDAKDPKDPNPIS